MCSSCSNDTDSDSLRRQTIEADDVAYQTIFAVTPRLWLALYKHRTTRDDVADFIRRRWLIDLYSDHSAQIVVKKASQVHITDFMLCTMFMHAQQGREGIYLLPTDRIAWEFTPRRIDPLIARVPYYTDNCGTQRGTKSQDNKTVKTLFGRAWTICGSNVITNLYEKSLDVILIDELNKCHMRNLEYARDRVGASEESYWVKISNPTFAGVGIDAEYERSDKKKWNVKCPHCNEWQPLSWFVNVVQEDDEKKFIPRMLTQLGDDVAVVCRSCNGILDRLSDGEWIAEFPERSISGYEINRIFADGRRGPRMRELFDAFLEVGSDMTRAQRFYNNELGVNYDAAGTFISEQLMSECAGDYTMPSSCDGSVAGVDVGAKLHVHISRLVNGVRIKYFIGAVHTWNELARLVALYNVKKGVIDAAPETHKAKEFVFAHAGWYLATYHPNDKVIDFKVNHTEKTVQTDRTQSLDISFAQYAEKRVKLPKNWRSLDNGDFVTQMIAVRRVFDEEKKPARYVWKAGDSDNLADHHRHADNYESIAARLYSDTPSVMIL